MGSIPGRGTRLEDFIYRPISPPTTLLPCLLHMPYYCSYLLVGKAPPVTFRRTVDSHTRETVNLYAVGVLLKINLTCLGGPVDMYKQTRGG